MIDHWLSPRNGRGPGRLNCLSSMASDETLQYFTDLDHIGRLAGIFIFEDEKTKSLVPRALFPSRLPLNGARSLSMAKTSISLSKIARSEQFDPVRCVPSELDLIYR